jgi:hypothetical protein
VSQKLKVAVGVNVDRYEWSWEHHEQ